MFAPLKRVLPVSVALLTTFVVSGAVHDLVTTAARGSVSFFFTPWFFLLGVGVLLGRAVHMDLSGRSWLVRALANILYILVCFFIVFYAL